METRCGDTSPFLQSPYIFAKKAALRKRPGSASTAGGFSQRAARIGDAKLIGDGRVPEHLRERFVLGAVGYRHDRSVAPAQRFAVMPGERVRIGGDQPVERKPDRSAREERSRPRASRVRRQSQASSQGAGGSSVRRPVPLAEPRAVLRHLGALRRGACRLQVDASSLLSGAAQRSSTQSFGLYDISSSAARSRTSLSDSVHCEPSLRV